MKFLPPAFPPYNNVPLSGATKPLLIVWAPNGFFVAGIYAAGAPGLRISPIEGSLRSPEPQRATGRPQPDRDSKPSTPWA
jgi:hypothetical protein